MDAAIAPKSPLRRDGRRTTPTTRKGLALLGVVAVVFGALFAGHGQMSSAASSGRGVDGGRKGAERATNSGAASAARGETETTATMERGGGGGAGAKKPAAAAGGSPLPPVASGQRWMEMLKIGEVLDNVSSYDYHLVHRLPVVEEYSAPIVTHLQKCAEMRGYIATASQKLEKAGEAVLSAANPELPKGKRATEGWLLTDAPSALSVALLYLLCTVASTIFLRLVCSLCSRTAAGRENEAARSKGLLLKFFSEPILIVQCLYNLAQVVLCAYMVLRAVDLYQLQKLQPVCNAFNATNPAVARLLWIFYASKVFDFCDTAFIVLRRKWKQLTFLHVYHHVTIFLFYWVNISVAYDGDIYFTVLLNSAVHCVMYSYYLLRTLEIPLPSFFKPLVTRLQMAQFVLMEAQAAYLLTHRKTCPFPARVTAAYAVYIFSLLILFQLFASKEYGGRRGGSSSERMGGRRSEKLKGA